MIYRAFMETPIQTNDKSYTLFDDNFKEHYHSTSDGALKESFNKHIIPAVTHCMQYLPNYINILDICYGLGYNTLGTIIYLQNIGFRGQINIYAPEINKTLVEKLIDFPYPLEFSQIKNIIKSITLNGFYSKDNVTIQIFFEDARVLLENPKLPIFQIIYQDPFSPKKNPFLWSYEYFCTLAKLLDKQGIITTYSQSSQIRYNAYLAGLSAYENECKDTRNGTIFLKNSLPHAKLKTKKIDIPHKLKVNPNLKALHDSEII